MRASRRYTYQARVQQEGRDLLTRLSDPRARSQEECCLLVDHYASMQEVASFLGMLEWAVGSQNVMRHALHGYHLLKSVSCCVQHATAFAFTFCSFHEQVDLATSQKLVVRS